MSRGSYRGGSTPVGWNANHYVAPSLTGRTRKGKALIKDLTARTAQSRTELAEQDRMARKRHGLGPRKPLPKEPPAVSSGPASGGQKSRKEARRSFTVAVVRRRRKRQSVSGSGPT